MDKETLIQKITDYYGTRMDFCRASGNKYPTVFNWSSGKTKVPHMVAHHFDELDMIALSAPPEILKERMKRIKALKPQRPKMKRGPIPRGLLGRRHDRTPLEPIPEINGKNDEGLRRALGMVKEFIKNTEPNTEPSSV